jgi:hypothetical protein
MNAILHRFGYINRRRTGIKMREGEEEHER